MEIKKVSVLENPISTGNMETGTKTCKQQQSQHVLQEHWHANRTVNTSHSESHYKYTQFMHDP